MILLEYLELSIRLAVNLHAGQFDKAGKPYILHPLRVMNNVNTIEEKIVGVLHDTIEDTELTLDELENLFGFPSNIVEAVNLLTKEKDVSYKEYILKIKNNELARVVKLADMRDNSDLFRLHEVEEKHLKMIKKYHWGMKQLRDDNKYLTSYK